MKAPANGLLSLLFFFSFSAVVAVCFVIFFCSVVFCFININLPRLSRAPMT